MADSSNPTETAPFNRDNPQWPMTYALQPLEEGAAPQRWWRHYYYRGPENQAVKVLYSKTKSHSETLAREFVNEPVLGFDMEWPWDAERRTRLQEKVALIQLASETKVALFHIALHEGETAEDLIAPSLKEIIESPTIIKTGVAILTADFRRLRAHFGLEPKGALELSHLHNLVTFGALGPRQVTTRLRSLASQVEQHLGLPLWKGGVRTSDWSRPLDYSQTQYAVTDAYASFMLFHCMNAKRLAMDPVPPFPRFAETYVTRLPRSSVLQLESVAEDGEVRIIAATDFFAVPDSSSSSSSTEQPRRRQQQEGGGDLDETEGGASGTRQKKERKPRKGTKRARNENVLELMDDACWALYERLAAHRKEVAVSKGISAFIVAYNTVLQDLTVHRPSNEQELLLIPGIGKGKAAEYGPSWLEIIATFQAEQKKEEEGDDGQQQEDGEGPGLKRREIDGVGCPGEILAPLAPPVLSTGISFQFGETSLTDKPPLTPP